MLIMEVLNCGRHGWVYLATLLTVLSVGARANTNTVYSPCTDTTVLKNDGFTLGLAIASNRSFFLSRIQFSPCDLRLQDRLRDSKIALFRPKVDEISLLIVNHTEFNPVSIVFSQLFDGSWFRNILKVNKCRVPQGAEQICKSLSIRSRQKCCFSLNSETLFDSYMHQALPMVASSQERGVDAKLVINWSLLFSDRPL